MCAGADKLSAPALRPVMPVGCGALVAPRFTVNSTFLCFPMRTVLAAGFVIIP
eukprot:COSAG01_NODE_27145_length_693_cov_0.934343_2_plen_52_part_01